MRKGIWVIIVLLLVGVICKGYFESVPEEVVIEELEIPEIVPYEHLFRNWADTVGWDWEMLAAVACVESRFEPNAKSPVGASGLMQLMPKTAAQYGLGDSTIFVPEENVRAGALYIRQLQGTFDFIGNKEEQTYFVLAAYNAGTAHVMDARRLAKRYGRSPYVWFDNTEYWLGRLNEPEIAADSVVHYGTFNAQETTSYVRKVLRQYKRISNIK